MKINTIENISNVYNIFIRKILSIILSLFCIVSFVILLSPNLVLAQDDDREETDEDSTGEENGEEEDEDDDGEDERTDEGEFLGYANINIDDLGRVKLTNELYKSDLKDTPGIPIYRYIKNEEGEVIQVKAYASDEYKSRYYLDYIINLDNDGVIILRAVFMYKYSERYVNFIEYYSTGKLEKIEFYNEEGKIYAIERYDESGTYTEFLGREKVNYIDPYGFYNTKNYNRNEELQGYGYYFPNDVVLLKEAYTTSTAGDMIIIYDKETRTRTVKMLNDDGQVKKAEYFDDKGNLIFYTEYEYNSNGKLSKITKYEQIEIIEDGRKKIKSEKIVFTFDNEKLVKRERYLGNKDKDEYELISTTNYNESSSSSNEDNEEDNQEDNEENEEQEEEVEEE
ncbi:MAG: hypothetical protein ACOCV8_00075 [Spirochaetota bacterium]